MSRTPGPHGSRSVAGRSGHVAPVLNRRRTQSTPATCIRVLAFLWGETVRFRPSRGSLSGFPLRGDRRESHRPHSPAACRIHSGQRPFTRTQAHGRHNLVRWDGKSTIWAYTTLRLQPQISQLTVPPPLNQCRHLIRRAEFSDAAIDAMEPNFQEPGDNEEVRFFRDLAHSPFSSSPLPIHPKASLPKNSAVSLLPCPTNMAPAWLCDRRRRPPAAAAARPV